VDQDVISRPIYRRTYGEVLRCMASYRRLCTDRQMSNRLNNRLHRVNKIQPVFKPVIQPVSQPVECLFTRCSRLFNRCCQTAQAVDNGRTTGWTTGWTTGRLNVCIHDAAGCQTGDDLTKDVLTIQGRFDWGRYDFGTFRRRDVLIMGRFGCKATRIEVLV